MTNLSGDRKDEGRGATSEQCAKKGIWRTLMIDLGFRLVDKKILA